MRLLFLYTFVGIGVPSLGFSFVSEIGRALERISSSRSSFSLIPGIRFEARQDVRRSLHQHATLIDSAEEVFTTHDLICDLGPGLEMRIFEADDGGFRVSVGPSKTPESGRTFHVMRRLRMAIIPIMFKLGVITTLLTMLTVFALKGLTIGVFLMSIAMAGVLSKLKPQQGYDQQHKDIHVHVHGGSPAYHYSEPHWDRESKYPPYYQDPYQQQYNNQPVPDNNFSHRSPWDSYIS